MALGKTVSYQPFEETSFGYGNTEIATVYATEFPDTDSIVRVTIEHATGNWDATGHLATPSIGTAVATYHKQQEYWTVKGERDDVDAVLAAMAFFPADKEETRTWTPTALKDNQTSGTYTDEEPPTIGDTTFTLRVYDGGTSIATETVTFSVTEAVFGNQRPYWSVAPTAEDLNSSSHDAVAGGLINLGTISHGTDTENVQIKCEFRPYGSTSIASTGSYGLLTDDSNIFIGDKKPALSNTTDARFDFTGSVAETQAYLDNVRYYNAGNQNTFDMHLTMTDGVVGSTITKTCYFSDSTVGVSVLSDQHYLEDGISELWGFGAITFTNVQPDVNYYTAILTIDATGRAGTSAFGTQLSVAVETYVPATGVLTLSDPSLPALIQALDFLEFTPVADFNSSFNMTVDFTFTNPTIGTTYSSAQQTVAITAQDVSEVTAGITSTHEYTEDQKYDFANVFEIIHGRNDQFDIVFTLSDADAGVLWRHGSSAFYRQISSGVYKLSGSRDDVNLALQQLYFTPSTDYITDFTIGITVDRTSGDLTFQTQDTGTLTMNAGEDLPEFTFPITTADVNWVNNVTKRFVSGLQITDTSVDNFLNFDVFGSTFTVVARLRQDNSAFTNGVLKTDISDPAVTVTGNFTNELTITGDKLVVNALINDLKFIPNPDFTEIHDFFVDYKITRDFDGVVFTEFSPSYQTLFTNPVISVNTVVSSPQFDWAEDTAFEFNSTLIITDTIAENRDYTAANGYDSWYESWYSAEVFAVDGSGNEVTEINLSSTNIGSATISGKGTLTDRFTIYGSKTDVNTALANLKMTPAEPDFTTTPTGGFKIEATIKRSRNSQFIFNRSPAVAFFNEGTASDEYVFPTGTFFPFYTEDIPSQYVFSNLHSGPVIIDGAGDLFPTAVYDVTFTLQNETTGKFVPYVEDGYFADEAEVTITDFAIRIVGSKAEVNTAIEQVSFSPFADVNTNVDVHVTIKRRYNNVEVTLANNQFAVTLKGVDTPEYVMGTAIGNLQFFVSDEFVNGLDLSSNRLHRTTDNVQVDQDILDGNSFAILTPKQISANIDLPYDAPITITDIFEDGGESLYKVVFDGGNLFTAKNEDLTTLGASLNITDTGWLSKETLNQVLSNGIYVTGVSEANGNIPNHAQIFETTFTVSRKTAAGTETQLTGHRSLRYFFVSGLTAHRTDTTVGSKGVSLERIDNRTETTDVEIFINEHLEFRDSRNKKRDSIQQQTSDFTELELFGRIKTIDDGTPYYSEVVDQGNDTYGRSGYHEKIGGLGGDGFGFDYFAYQSWLPLQYGLSQGQKGLTLGNKFVIDYRSYQRSIYDYDNMGVVRSQVQIFVWTEWGAYIKLGAETTSPDTGFKLFFRQN